MLFYLEFSISLSFVEFVCLPHICLFALQDIGWTWGCWTGKRNLSPHQTNTKLVSQRNSSKQWPNRKWTDYTGKSMEVTHAMLQLCDPQTATCQGATWKGLYGQDGNGPKPLLLGTSPAPWMGWWVSARRDLNHLPVFFQCTCKE